MRTSLDDFHLLCRIIETGSLRAAAEEIRTDPSNVTRRLSGLEDRLGVRLINRSRVRSTATDVGQRYYSELKNLLEQLEALEDAIAGVAGEPRGLLRVAGPSVFGARCIGPWLHELQAQFPRLAIDLVLTDRPIDLVEQGIDIAVTIGRLKDSSLIGVRLGTMLTVVVATPDYLSRYGTAKTPSDIQQHHFVLHTGQLQTAELTLTGAKGRTVTIRCRSRFTVSSILGVREAVMAGAGLNAGPLWLYADALDRGELIRVLPDWNPPRYPVHALMLPGRYRPAKTNSALAMLRVKVPELPGVVS
jgi:DNA-binding transcriptional LysR family regulator